MNESKTNIGYILFLSIVAALGGFLFGYDTAVISGTIAQVSQQFGLTTLQEGWYVGCALVGSIGELPAQESLVIKPAERIP